MADTDSRRFRLRSDALEWREVEGEIVALDLRTSRYLSVNQTGAVLWHSLAAGATQEQLASKLVDEFGIDTATASADLDSFLESLTEQDLLE